MSTQVQIVLRGDSIDRLVDLIGPGLTVVVSGRSSYQSSGIRDLLQRSFRGNLIELARASSPSMAEVESLATELNRRMPDRIIAAGGGGILDLAKAARKSAQLKIPLIAIPTTAGSGSEATPYASISVEDSGSKSGYKKISLSDSDLIPSIVCFQPSVLMSVPKRQRAISGMDVIVQSAESYWSRFQTDASTIEALASIRLWARFFPAYLAGGICDCESVQLAAFYAGRAISRTPTTACHAISYPLTMDFGIPHGWAVALTFREVLQWNSSALKDRASDFCDAFGVSDLAAVAAFVGEVMESAGIPSQLRAWGIQSQDVPYIVERSYRPDRMNGSPRAISPDDLSSMLKRLL